MIAALWQYIMWRDRNITTSRLPRLVSLDRRLSGVSPSRGAILAHLITKGIGAWCDDYVALVVTNYLILRLSNVPNLEYASFSEGRRHNCIVSQLWPQSPGSLLSAGWARPAGLSHPAVYSFSLATNCLPAPPLTSDILTNNDDATTVLFDLMLVKMFLIYFSLNLSLWSWRINVPPHWCLCDRKSSDILSLLPIFFKWNFMVMPGATLTSAPHVR